jgi:hypothetical protein
MSTHEELMAAIYGISRRGDVMHISVYAQGKAVRLLGPRLTVSVSTPNRANIDGWKREAALVWDLTHLMGIPRILFHSDTEKSKLDSFREEAASIKAELEGSPNQI